VREGPLATRTCFVYQALQFLLSSHLPEGQVPNMTDAMRWEIWVLGILHARANYVRHCTQRKRGFLFHIEFNEGGARTSLLGRCPELVRIETSLKWHNIHCISTEVPRVVHPNDVRIRRVHVVGRQKHYVCGVSAVEDLSTNTFNFTLLPRYGFCMYPEERLGMDINSASIMWDHVEEIFKRIRGCMSAGRQGTSSATFSMPLSATVFDFGG
jgi:hypothetical protein